MAERTTIRLVAGANPRTGAPVHEEVLVDRLAADRYRIIATPALVLGIAAGDVVRVEGGDVVEILSRGGNVALQIHGSHEAADSIADEVQLLGGSMDARAPQLTVYTIPVSVGFPRIEQLANSLSTEFAGVEWYYGNVYDNDDGTTPLNWWK